MRLLGSELPRVAAMCRHCGDNRAHNPIMQAGAALRSVTAAARGRRAEETAAVMAGVRALHKHSFKRRRGGRRDCVSHRRRVADQAGNVGVL